MSSIVTSILSSTVGLLWNKARDSTAAKLKDGDVTDAKIREIIVRDMNDIKTKLDGLSRKDLLSSYNFLQEGVDFLHDSLQNSKLDQKALTNETQDDRGETSTTRSCGQSGILSEIAVELSQAMGKLKCNSNINYESAKERFKDARKRATDAFSTETLVLKDKIFAAKLRIVSEMLECLDRPETGITGCLSFLKKFHSLPAIQEIFSVYLNGGIKSMLNKSERVENVKSVMLINYVLFQYVLKFSSKYSFDLLVSMPIELPDRIFSPILHWQEVATRKSMGKELTQHPNGLILDQEIFPYVSAVNGHGDVLTLRYCDTDKIQVISYKTGEWKMIKLPDPRKGEVIMQYIAGLAVDNNNNVYVVVWLKTRTENGDVTNFVLHVLDENYHVKHDHRNNRHYFYEHDSCRLDFMDASFSFVNIAINKNNNIIMIKGKDPHVYICDNTGMLLHKFEHDSSGLPRLGISEQDKIITSSADRKAMVTFSEEGNLKSTVQLPEDHEICGVAYHYVIRKIIVLTRVRKTNSYFLLCYTEAGDLESSMFFCKIINYERIQITSHPSGPGAVVREKSITFI